MCVWLSGAFGNIYIGELIGAVTPTSVVKVLIKTLDEAVDLNAEEEFYAELNLYTGLKHRNLSNLIGVHATCNTEFLFDNVTPQADQFPKCMIMEYLCNGNLHDYLLQRAQANTNLTLNSGCSGMNRNVSDFVYIAQQVACAMDYLISMNYVHKDISARNVLIGDNLLVKLTDIAQYTDKYTKDYYKLQNKCLPVRWMAPESLLFGRYAADTDVWSFGVLLWEIFSYGATPYTGHTNPEVVQLVRDRELLLIPDECPHSVYQVMTECWHENSVQRPTFADILNRFKSWDNAYNTANVHSMPSTNTNTLSNGFALTNSYSSNSQNSCANNNTGSTAISTSSPLQPASGHDCYLPPPLPHTTASLFSNMKFKRPHSPPSSTITSCSSSRIYRELETNSTTRSSQRQLIANYAMGNGVTNTNLASNKNLIPSI
jgi:serine/threonine protein kinase